MRAGFVCGLRPIAFANRMSSITLQRASDSPTLPTIAALTNAASIVLKRLYKPDFRYAKAGVMLEELSDSAHVQGSPFGGSEPSPE
jgi:hypothetical protein